MVEINGSNSSNDLFNGSNHSYNSLNWVQSDRCIWGEFTRVRGATALPPLSEISGVFGMLSGIVRLYTNILF